MTRVNMKTAHKKTQTHALLVVRLTVQNYGMYPIILILKLGHKKKTVLHKTFKDFGFRL